MGEITMLKTVVGTLALLGAVLVFSLGWAMIDYPMLRALDARCIADGGQLANMSGTFVCVDADAAFWIEPGHKAEWLWPSPEGVE